MQASTIKRAIAMTAVALPTAVVAAGALPITAGLLDTKLDNGLFPVSLGIAAAAGGLAGATASLLYGPRLLKSTAIGAGIGLGVTLAVDAALLFVLTDR